MARTEPKTSEQVIAGVLTEHRRELYGSEKWSRCTGCTWLPMAFSNDVTGEFSAHQAVEVVAALGLREQWGVQYERQANPTMNNPSGIVTNTVVVHSQAHAEQAVKVGAPVNAMNRRVVRHEVTDWRPDDGDQR